MLRGSAGKIVVYMTNSTDRSLKEKTAKFSKKPTQKATAWIYAINIYNLPYTKFYLCNLQVTE